MKHIILLFLLTLSIFAQTIKDISNIVGVRENKLIGYGIVVGLNGTGDKNDVSDRALNNLFRNANIKFADGDLDSDNVATVMVTASLPPFARQGDKLKVKISSISKATNIDAGELLLTQLKAVDGEVYAIAQGTVTATKNKTTGYIYEGAIVEREVEYLLKDEKFITLSLLKHDAKVATDCEDKINEKFGKRIATAYDTRTIEVMKPDNMSMVRFISEVQNIQLNAQMKKKVVIDPVKGIVIAGADITINPVTISREKFTLRIRKTNLDDKSWEDDEKNKGIDIGDDVKIGNKPVEVSIDNALINTKAQPTISDLMRAMKVMKVSLNEIIETIKMLDSLGAINADVEIVR